jgi:type VI secretion system secreted protein VgrG
VLAILSAASPRRPPRNHLRQQLTLALKLTQDKRPLTATTTLGDNVLLPVGLVGEEALSRPFRYTVDFISTNFNISGSSLLGEDITLHLQIGETIRHFNGIVSRFSAGGHDREFARYRAEVVPKMWLLQLSNASRTFEEKAPLDIVEKACKDELVTKVERTVASPPAALPYVVQYRETTFAFVSRLLEESGLYYTFSHKDGSHSLIFSDAVGSAIPAGIAATVRVSSAVAGGAVEADVAYQLEREQTMHSASVALQDHDLLREDSTGSASSTSKGAQGRRADFLGDLGPNDSTGEAKRLIEIEEASYDVIRGASNHAALASGTRVKFTGGALGAAGLEMHLVRVRHRLEIGDMVAGGGFEATYENDFEAIPAATRFRPERDFQRPSVRGNQTAKIVGSGDEGAIDVDENGRVLLRFPWDTGDGKDGKSKHRVHVASVWGGAGWGFVQHPRLGQEVLVEFLEGDVARPIVTGRVYNSSNTFPYPLPGSQSQSGWKSRTVGGGSDNFNEIRFEDEKGKEHVFVQAEKDLQTNVKNDETRDVGHDRTTTIKNADTRTVKEGDDTHVIEKGEQKITVKEKDQTITIEKGNQTFVVKTGDQTQKVEQGNRVVEVSVGNNSLKVKTGNHEVTVDTGNITVKASAGKITLEAAQSIELKVGPSTLKLDPSGITAKGALVKIEAQGQLSAKGAMVQIEGSGMTQIKAPMTQVNGDGMVMVKGGVTMIN